MQGHGGQVFGRGVPLVMVEAEAWIGFVQQVHLPVARHFGHDRRGRDG